MNALASIFRAYDIRGIVGETLTEENVYRIGQAIGTAALDQGEDTVIIGRDGRLSGPQLSKPLANGLMATGCNVIDIGAVPTPVLYFAASTLATHSGVMLTGSHNPANYNGFKIVIAGKTLSGAAIQALYDCICKQSWRTGQGTYTVQPMNAAYSDYIVKDIHLARPLKVVIDAGNGIAGDLAPALYRRLGCEVIPLFCEVDGHFPNHHPDPSQVENLQALISRVRDEGADIGLAFDGDADRLGVVTNTGTIIWPDRQLMLLAQAVLAAQPGASIIYDVKCSRHLATVIKQHGGHPIMWKTGHSFIKNKLRETGAPLAGEMSGHMFFNDRWFGFDDAIYSGARLLEVLSQSTLSPEDVFKTIPDSVNTPELKIAIPEEEKFLLMERFIATAQFPGATLATIDGLRVDFDHGWGLIRPSNTSPYWILRFESDDQPGLTAIQELFRQQLHRLNPALMLPF